MNWIFLSFLSAFGHAFGWALKKRALNNEGINNSIGFFSFLTAGGVLFLLFFLSGEALPQVTDTFLWAAAVVIICNVLAVWASYRALDKAAFSRLMPFVSLTALAIIPIEYVLRGILPGGLQIVGAIIVVLGTFFFSRREEFTQTDWTVVGYFSITLAAYSLSSAVMGVAVAASGSGLFTATVLHLGIAFGFLPLLFITKEPKVLRQMKESGQFWKMFGLVMLAGLAIALLENGPATIALEQASASEVFALKRTMPFFALFLGVIMFKEKITWRHATGTFLLVLGSVLIVWQNL